MKKIISIMVFCIFSCALVCVGSHVTVKPDKDLSGIDKDVGPSKIFKSLIEKEIAALPVYHSDFECIQHQVTDCYHLKQKLYRSFKKTDKLYILHVAIRQCTGETVATVQVNGLKLYLAGCQPRQA